VCYDITASSTLEDDRSLEQTEKQWIPELVEQLPLGGGPCVCILGCKSDLHDKRQVTYEQGRAVADKFAAALKRTVHFGECSAKTGQGIDAIMGRVMRQRQKWREVQKSQMIEDKSRPKKQCLIS